MKLYIIMNNIKVLQSPKARIKDMATAIIRSFAG